MLISVIIPAYNEEKYIGKTLQSIRELELGDNQLEILVIDADSKDKTEQVARSFGAKVVNVVHKGIGFARQQGVLSAKGDIIVFTDADTLVPEDWLVKYIKVLSKPGVVAAYGSYRVTDGNFPYFQITNFAQPVAVWVASKMKMYLAGGQNIAAWREKAMGIGGFDEKLELLEDADFIKRMGRVGKIAYLSDNIVFSAGRRSKEGLKYFWRAGVADFEFFFLGRRKFQKFPDYR